MIPNFNFIASNCAYEAGVKSNYEPALKLLDDLKGEEDVILVMDYLEDFYLPTYKLFSRSLKDLKVKGIITQQCHWFSADLFSVEFGENFLNYMCIDRINEYIRGDIVFIGENNKGLGHITDKHITQIEDHLELNDTTKDLREEVTLIEEVVVTGGTVNKATKLLREIGVKKINLICPHVFNEDLNIDKIFDPKIAHDELKDIFLNIIILGEN